MIRNSSGNSHVDDLMGLMIGAAGALCIWAAVMGGMGGCHGAGADWVASPDGDLRWFDGQSDRIWNDEDGDGWFGVESIDFNFIRGADFALGESFPSKKVVVLVHGLDEPGGIWDAVAPALLEAGHQVVRFDYPNDQAILRSAEGFAKAVAFLEELGVEQIDIVAHSMGGLVARETLTNPDMGASTGTIGGVEIGRLILVGTPNEGSAWARLRGVAEVRERVQRWMASDDMDLSILSNLSEDGDGQAGIDLRPGSVFLTELNGRPMPASVVVTCIVGRIVDPKQTAGMKALDDTAAALGDGVVSVESGSLDGCTDVVLLVANHRSMIRTVEIEEGWRAMTGQQEAPSPEGIAIILDRLSED